MALKRPGDRAVLLLARLLKSIDEATRNPMLRGLLNQSEDAKQYLSEARQIVADAKSEITCAAELKRGVEGGDDAPW